MPKIASIYRLALLVLVVASGDIALGTRCLVSTEEDLVRAFPIVIEGKVLERRPLDSERNAFELRISVEKALKGEAKDKEFRVVESHEAHVPVKKIIYQVGKTYVFPIRPMGKDQQLAILLPSDGCPELPAR